VHRNRVALRGGAVNFYECGDGEPVVLLHGLLGSPAYLAGLARSLGRSGRRVMVPELPGHGGSTPLEGFTLEAAADLVADAAALAGAERPAVFGHSLGAALAVHWAARRPIRSLVAASPVGVLALELGPARRLAPVAGAVARTIEPAAELLARTRGGRRAVFGWFVGMQEPDAVPPELGARLIRSAAGASRAIAAVLPELARRDLPAVAASVECPSLTIWGERDAHAGNGDAFADALGGSRIELAEIGHMPMLEAPFTFRAALRGWL
jgi:pimeloyl-ACP methyl ester carboxylesterase